MDQFEQNRHDVINEMKHILMSMEEYGLNTIDVDKTEVERWMMMLHAKDLQFCK